MKNRCTFKNRKVKVIIFLSLENRNTRTGRYYCGSSRGKR